MNHKNITVLIPAYNEEKRIKDTIEGVKETGIINEIIVIDDGSSDNTYKIAKETGAIVYKMPKNLGKGEALTLGVSKANGEIIAFLDADLGHTSIEVEKLINPLIRDEADVVIAKFPPAIKKGGFGLVKKLAKNGVKFFTGYELTSTLSGQRVFKKEVLNNFKKFYSGYGVEVGMIIDILKMGYKVKEVQVNMKHAETERNLKGFIHRGKQFYHITKVLTFKALKIK